MPILASYRGVFLNLPGQREAVHAGHLSIQQNQSEAIAGTGVLTQDIEGCRS